MSTLAVALETSTRTPSLAARSGERTLATSLASSRAHASDLLPALEALLRELGVEAASLSAVVVGTGPGSYTGLRVGVATALGLVRATGASLVGLPSVETHVYGSVPIGAEAAVVIDARAGEVYYARYRRLATDVEAVVPPCVVPAAQLEPLLPRGARVLADDDAVRVAALERRSDLSIDRASRPRAEAALELGLARLAARGADAPSSVEPLYLRAFAAKQRRR